VGTLELSEEVFGAPVNKALLYESVRHYLAGTRRGTASTKTRHEVAGSGKKLWRQKGTGRARVGAEPKSKQMRKTLDGLEIKKTVLLVDNGENRNLGLSSRNLAGVKLVASHEVNVYDLLGHEQVLLSQAAAKKLSEALA
jgi:large subunit ribosomal protein L4